jgi:hypothetical protein
MDTGIIIYISVVTNISEIYISGFMKIGSGILKLIGWIYRHTNRMEIA